MAAESLMETDQVAAKDLLDDEYLLEDLVAAETSNIAEKRSVLPPRIERHSEDIVLRMRLMLTMMMMMMMRIRAL